MLKNALSKIYMRMLRRNIRKASEIDVTSSFGTHVCVRESHIGYYSKLNTHSSIYHTWIGNYTQLGQYVRVNPVDHIYTNFAIGYDIYKKGEAVFAKSLDEFGGYEVKIGNDVWIGDRAIIFCHTEIGNGAIIGGGAVVTRSVPPYAVVGGNPARFIKWRFSEDVIRHLEETQWYTWPIEKVMDNREELEKIVSFDMDEYISQYNHRKKDIKC